MYKFFFPDINGTLAKGQYPPCKETKGIMIEMQREGNYIVEITGGSKKQYYNSLNSNLKDAFLQYGNGKYQQYTVLGNACEIYLNSIYRNDAGAKFDKKKVASSLEVLANELHDFDRAKKYHEEILATNYYLKRRLKEEYGSKIIFQDNDPAKLTAKPSVEMMMDNVELDGFLEKILLQKQVEEKRGAQVTGDCFSILDYYLGEENRNFRGVVRYFMGEIKEFIKNEQNSYNKGLADKLECHVYDDAVDSLPPELTKPAGVRYILNKMAPSKDVCIAFAGDNESDYEMTNVAKEFGINYIFIAPADSKIAKKGYSDVFVVECPGVPVVKKAKEWLQVQ